MMKGWKFFHQDLEQNTFSPFLPNIGFDVLARVVKQEVQRPVQWNYKVLIKEVKESSWIVDLVKLLPACPFCSTSDPETEEDTNMQENVPCLCQEALIMSSYCYPKCYRTSTFLSTFQGHFSQIWKTQF